MAACASASCLGSYQKESEWGWLCAASGGDWVGWTRRSVPAAATTAAIASAIGVAGTVTSVAADHLGLTEYSREAVHRTILSRETIREANLRWLGMPAADIADGSLMPPLRASVIGAGSTILDEIAQRVPSGEVIVSETDILDGIAHELLAR